MSIILNLETSTSVCSVALAKDGKLMSLREVNDGFSHSENLTGFINDVCREQGVRLEDLDAVAVSSGPGSYTGLRIGASTAKGLCYALNKPLIAVDTLQSLAAIYLQSHSPVDLSALLVPMLDARRMEVYTAAYDAELNMVSSPTALVINGQSFSTILKSKKIIYFGDGAAKCRNVLPHSGNAVFADVIISAAGMVAIAEEKYLKKEFEDVSLFEPNYLKEAAIGNPNPIIR